jgi:VIT1/CCC1 family predicted Fe2+/Mn2+ transporter
MAGFGVCKGIVEGRKFSELLPFYIISLFGIYLYLSVVSMVDMAGRRNALKVNLVDYLENTVAKRLEQGMADNERLRWESREDREEQNIAAIENEEGFSYDDAKELEELLKTIIGNKA